MIKYALAAAALLQFAGISAAQGNAPAGTIPVRFACGGVGDGEQQMIKEAAPRHSALLTFAAKSGAYVADVDVKISNAAGQTVLQGLCTGPMMLVDLPQHGRYVVEASFKGEAQRQTITVGDKTARAIFTWPLS